MVVMTRRCLLPNPSSQLCLTSDRHSRLLAGAVQYDKNVAFLPEASVIKVKLGDVYVRTERQHSTDMRRVMFVLALW